MNFSSKVEKPSQYSPITPISIPLQRKSFTPQQQETNPETTFTPKAEGVGHHIGKIAISSPIATIQTKLTIGKVGDRYEQEADHVAQQVVTMPTPTANPVQREEMPGEDVQAKSLVQREEDSEDELQKKPLVSGITPIVQREEMPKEDEMQMKPLVQRQEMPKEEEEELAQAKGNGGGSQGMDMDTLETQLSSSRGGGSPLPEETRSFMEPRFGSDFSQVKVHTDSSASQMNQSIQAQAFTHGQDIYFNAGKYSPQSDEGKSLLAHELTHVVQQRGGE